MKTYFHDFVFNFPADSFKYCLKITVPSDNKTVPPDNKTVPPDNKTVPPDNKTVPLNNKTIPTDNKTELTRLAGGWQTHILCANYSYLKINNQIIHP